MAVGSESFGPASAATALGLGTEPLAPTPILPQLKPPTAPDVTSLVPPSPSFRATTYTPPAPTDFTRYLTPAQTIDPKATAAYIQSLIGSVPRVTAPTAAPGHIDLPGGTMEAFQKSIYESQFAPVERALGRQHELADTALSGQLAEAGLADSGSGVGQRALLREDYSLRTEQAARDISAAATATAIGAEIQVASANAQMTQQANLANAGFNMEAQRDNASNILNGNLAAAQGYVTALGLNERAVESFRDSFLQAAALTETSRMAREKLKVDVGLAGDQLKMSKLIEDDKLKSDAMSHLFNFTLQRRALDLQNYDLQAKNDIQRVKLAMDKQAQDQSFWTAMEDLSLKVRALGNTANSTGSVGGLQDPTAYTGAAFKGPNTVLSGKPPGGGSVQSQDPFKMLAEINSANKAAGYSDQFSFGAGTGALGF